MASMSEGCQRVRGKPKSGTETQRRARRGAAHLEEWSISAILIGVLELLVSYAAPGARSYPAGRKEFSKADKFARLVMQFLGMNVDTPTPLLVDNEPMWFNVRNDVVSSETQHWANWQRFVRECYLYKLIAPYKINTDDELADLLTKAIAREDEKFKRFRNALMNIE